MIQNVSIVDRILEQKLQNIISSLLMDLRVGETKESNTRLKPLRGHMLGEVTLRQEEN